jgi:hypothetical protein
MLTVHHLQRGQSDRIVWLCEELGIEYKLVNYQRDKKTLLAPPEFKALCVKLLRTLHEAVILTKGQASKSGSPSYPRWRRHTC